MDIPEGAWPIPRGWEWKTGPAADYLLPDRRFDHFRSNGYVVTSVVFPHWLLMLVLLMFPTLRVLRTLRKRNREELNLCPTCGYDLRATPDRCPECGTKGPTPPAPAAAATARATEPAVAGSPHTSHSPHL